MFRKWLAANGLSTAMSEASELTVRQFILELQQRPGRKNRLMSSHSVANRVRALRAFFSWLARKGYIEANPLADLRPPKTTDQVVEPLTNPEIDQIQLKKCEKLLRA